MISAVRLAVQGHDITVITTGQGTSELLELVQRGYYLGAESNSEGRLQGPGSSKLPGCAPSLSLRSHPAKAPALRKKTVRPTDGREHTFRR